MRVLIVDDEPVPLEDMRLSLIPAGFAIETTTDPTDALERYEHGRYDAVISDVRMPGMDGITLLRKLREIDRNARVIIVTAYGDVETAIAAINEGAYAFFCKPVSFPELIQRLRYLERQRIEEHDSQLEQLLVDTEHLRTAYRDLVQQTQELLNRYKEYGYRNT